MEKCLSAVVCPLLLLGDAASSDHPAIASRSAMTDIPRPFHPIEDIEFPEYPAR